MSGDAEKPQDDAAREPDKAGWPEPPSHPGAEAAAEKRAAMMAMAKKRERRMFARWAAGCWAAAAAWIVFSTPEIAILDWRTGLHVVVGIGLAYVLFGDVGWVALQWIAERRAKHSKSRKSLISQLKWLRAFAYIGLGVLVYYVAKAALLLAHARLPEAAF